MPNWSNCGNILQRDDNKLTALLIHFTNQWYVWIRKHDCMMVNIQQHVIMRNIIFNANEGSPSECYSEVVHRGCAVIDTWVCAHQSQRVLPPTVLIALVINSIIPCECMF